MASTKYDIANAAIILCGGTPLSDFGTGDADADTVEELSCYHLYDSVVETMFSLYNWRFAEKTAQLSLSGTTPDTKWDYAYTEPSDMIALVDVGVGDAFSEITFDRQAGEILCNQGSGTAVYAKYTYQPSVSTWPPYFVSLCETALARRLSFPLSAKLDLGKALDVDWDMMFRYAKNADAKQQTPRKLNTTGRNTIIRSRKLRG